MSEVSGVATSVVRAVVDGRRAAALAEFEAARAWIPFRPLTKDFQQPTFPTQDVREALPHVIKGMEILKGIHPGMSIGETLSIGWTPRALTHAISTAGDAPLIAGSDGFAIWDASFSLGQVVKRG